MCAKYAKNMHNVHQLYAAATCKKYALYANIYIYYAENAKVMQKLCKKNCRVYTMILHIYMPAQNFAATGPRPDPSRKTPDVAEKPWLT